MSVRKHGQIPRVTLRHSAVIASHGCALLWQELTRTLMNKTALTVDPRRRWSKRLLLTSAIFGCATTSGMQTLQAQTLPTTDPMARRPVHAVPLPTNGTDDQASWIIEPDAPRIPKIAGVDATLPPHIERRMSYAFDLAQRGAIYTANSEFRGVLGLCALELDSREGGTRRREALRQGFTALDQSDDLEVGQPRRAENGTSRRRQWYRAGRPLCFAVGRSNSGGPGPLPIRTTAAKFRMPRNARRITGFLRVGQDDGRPRLADRQWCREGGRPATDGARRCAAERTRGQRAGCAPGRARTVGRGREDFSTMHRHERDA